MKPGTSIRVTKGMLNESQNLINLAALTEASISNEPARCCGCCAMIPIDCPASLAKPTTIFLAQEW